MSRFTRPSPSMLVALLALLVALGGTSYAALALPKGSVGTPQLKQDAVTSPKVKKGTLRLTDVRPADRAKMLASQTRWWAAVNGDGTLDRGRGVAKVEHPATGSYSVKFRRNVTRCAQLATPASFDIAPSLGARVANVNETNARDTVNVSMYLANPSVPGATNNAFYLVLIC